jgi:hypothetical protein
MIDPLAEARQALTGVIEMLTGRPDFRTRFDVSARGVLRSYQAALLAVPFTAFGAIAQRTLAARSSGALDGGIEPYSTAFALTRFVADWGYFPLFAALVAALLARRAGWAPWVVVTNWVHLLTAIAETVPLALLVMGQPQAGSLAVVALSCAGVYAAVLAARAALDLPWTVAIPAGCAGIATMLIIDLGLHAAL